MLKYLLDTNVLGHYVRQAHPALNAKFERASLANTLAISVITRAETLYGVALMDKNDKRRKSIPALLADLPTLDWQAKYADAYAQIDARLTQEDGQSIGVLDAMIAAHAQVEKLILVTHNTKHFKRVPNLKIEDWTVA
jgi:tRNA(fMet)-specific endonuclease VapC